MITKSKNKLIAESKTKIKNYTKTRRRREHIKRSKLKSAMHSSMHSSAKKAYKLRKNASDLLYHQTTDRASRSTTDRSARSKHKKAIVSSNSKKKANKIKKSKSSAHIIPYQAIGNDENMRSKSLKLKSENVNISMSDVKIKSLLGEGAFSKVYLAQINKSEMKNKLIALKVIPRKDGKDKKKNKNLMWERLVLSQLTHPFIVEYFGQIVDKKQTCFLMEFVIGGEILFHFEQSRLGRFPPSVARFYIAEIVCALEHVHANGFVYRDLKPENVLLDEFGHVKLCDFGFAKKLKANELTFTLCGSKEYVAPEVLLGDGHNGAADLWSLGCLTFEFVIGHLPFPTQDSSPYEVLDIIKSTKLCYPHFVSKIIRDFIGKLLTFNPLKRASFKTIRAHPWFNEFDWKRCNDKQLKPPIVPKCDGRDDVKNFANARFGNADNPVNTFDDLKLF